MTEKNPSHTDETVESVVTNIIKLKDDIANITLHIEWKNGIQGVYGNSKTLDEYAMASMLIQQFAMLSLKEEGRLTDENFYKKPTIH
jgi:hypothetical protein|tara:strand:- start:1998 stop:2258 length:261 start_codon:yes stop_codon:yes gene_type:complete